MPKEDEFKYDPEAEEDTKKYRLPFALCKSHGITIQDWWTPRDAWEALRRGGHVDDVSEEYKEFYRQKKKEAAKEKSKSRKEREEKKKKQLADIRHNPDKNYVHKDGYIADAPKGKPMTFEEADSGKVNPFYGKSYIGYRHNCQTCVATFIARKLGYDVRALPNLNNKTMRDLSFNTMDIYKTENGGKPTLRSKPYRMRKIDFLEKECYNGGTFALEFHWNYTKGGHIIIAEKQNGQLRLYDPQVNELINDRKRIESYLSLTKNIRVADLTKCSIREEIADKVMKRS